MGRALAARGLTDRVWRRPHRPDGRPGRRSTGRRRRRHRRHPRPFLHGRSGPQRVDRVDVVAGMHERKARMAGLSQGFLALPGGYGTFEELFEILTWAQIGLHTHPIGLLNTQGYFDPLLALIDHAGAEGFLEKARPVRPIVEPEPLRLLGRLIEAEHAAKEEQG